MLANASDLESALAVFSGVMVFILVINVVLAVLMIVSNWKLFTKAGEPGWAILIPVYNLYVMIKIAFNGSKNWLIIFYLITPVATLISTGLLGFIFSLATYGISIYIGYQFTRRYADTGLAVAALFVPIIIYPIIAFGREYEYEGYF